jgi:uncharacterized membrane protein
MTSDTVTVSTIANFNQKIPIPVTVQYYYITIGYYCTVISLGIFRLESDTVDTVLGTNYRILLNYICAQVQKYLNAVLETNYCILLN